MDAAAQFPGSAPGLVRLLEHCRLVDYLTQSDTGNTRGRLDDALGPELACWLVAALTKERRRVALPV
jgi:hypothetical protein